MTFEPPGDGALDYFPCRYGASRLVFRGPRRDLSLPYVSVLGGTETYGRYIADPYPTLVEVGQGLSLVNLGLQNAGLDAYLKDPDILAVASAARVAVVQVMGAQNLSNRFYAVHPRRNDRFLHPTPLLQRMFETIDFTEFHFTRGGGRRVAVGLGLAHAGFAGAAAVPRAFGLDGERASPRTGTTGTAFVRALACRCRNGGSRSRRCRGVS